MTNEQLTKEVLRLSEEQAKSVAEHEKLELILQELQADVKSTKTLAEDVHILAINMENMQKAQDEMNKKVDALTSKEFVEYKENKKQVKNQIISGLTGAGITVFIGFIGFLIKLFIQKGGI